MRLPTHAKGNLTITYSDLYKVMPQDELEEALTAYGQARGLTVQKLGRALTAAEFRLRARLFARHQTLTRAYDPLHKVKAEQREPYYNRLLKKGKRK